MTSTWKRIAVVLLVVVIGSLTPECTKGDRCEGPGDAIDPTSDRPTGELPTWAIGGFGRHNIDVENFRIEEDGTAYDALDGGDYGGCSALTAMFSDGRVHLVVQPGDMASTHTVIVRTTEGRFFVGPSDNEDLTCGWLELEAGNLCGTKVGGCGGYGDAESCSWEEVSERMGCEPSQ